MGPHFKEGVRQAFKETVWPGEEKHSKIRELLSSAGDIPGFCTHRRCTTPTR